MIPDKIKCKVLRDSEGKPLELNRLEHGSPAQSCSPKWRDHAFMYSDATDTLDNIRHAARDYKPESRRFFYESVKEQLESLIQQENDQAQQRDSV